MLKCIFFITLLLISQSKSLKTNPSILIIGSGASGIAAATRLLNNNFTNIQILEAENRIGGRINSIYFGDAYVDMGAQFCHGEEDNIVYSLVKDLDVLRHSKQNDKFFYSNGDRLDEATQSALLSFAESLEGTETISDACRGLESVGACLDKQFTRFYTSQTDSNQKTILRDAHKWLESHLCAFDSAFDLNDLNITSAYRKCTGDLRMHWNGSGYKTVLEVMMKTHPEIDGKILLNTQVTGVNWQSNQPKVFTSDGNLFQVDHVIVTPSLGVLKNRSSLFDPELPSSKRRAIQRIGFGAIVKIQLRFPVRWWKDDAKWYFVWSEEDKRKLEERSSLWLTDIAKLLQASNNPKVLTAWFAGKYVPLIEKLPHETLADGLKFLLKTFFESHANLTEPDHILRSKWYSNPHFLGTYSYESVQSNATQLQNSLASPLTKDNNKPIVLFAGEATHSYYFSTVHGAIESGYREADRLIQYYK